MEMSVRKASLQMSMEMGIPFDAEILGAVGKASQKEFCERSRARTIFHDDIPGFQGDVVKHRFGKIARTREDSSDACRGGCKSGDEGNGLSKIHRGILFSPVFMGCWNFGRSAHWLMKSKVEVGNT
jgi:hypothetical protein